MFLSTYRYVGFCILVLITFSKITNKLYIKRVQIHKLIANNKQFYIEIRNKFKYIMYN